MVRSRRRWWTWSGFAVIALVVVALFWVGFRVAQAQHALSHAGEHFTALQRDLLAGDATGAHAEAKAIEKETTRARDKSGGWVVGLAADVPYLGRSARAVRSLSRSADDLANGPLRSLLDMQSLLSANSLRGSDGTVDLTSVSNSAPQLQAIARQLEHLRARVQEAPRGTFVLAPINSGRKEALRRLDDVIGHVAVAARFAQIGPAMLGDRATRHYLVVVQNNNQARGTGGVADAYATVDVRLGKASVTKTASVSTLPNARSWSTVNFSPDFPVAAARWRALYLQAVRGASVDGVVALDPVAFEHSMLATGPLQARGRTLASAMTIVHLAEVQYATFAKPRIRDNALALISKPILRAVFAGEGSAESLASQLGEAASQGHLHIWSAHANEESVLTQTSFGGALTAAARPFAEVVVNNTSGARLDYFVARSVAYSASSCHGSTRPSSVVLRLDNNTAEEPPPFLAAHSDHPPAGTPPTQLRFSVRIYVTPGAKLDLATLDGTPVAMRLGTERGHPVYSLDLAVNRFSVRDLSLQLTEPTLPGPPLVPQQPLARPQMTTVDATACKR